MVERCFLDRQKGVLSGETLRHDKEDVQKLGPDRSAHLVDNEIIKRWISLIKATEA
jgi:hypothetical protein